MRIQIASDLHPDMLHRSFPGCNPVAPAEADGPVLAGDIAARAEAVGVFAHWPAHGPAPVIDVHGNHEAWGLPYAHLCGLIRDRSAGTAGRYLNAMHGLSGRCGLPAADCSDC